MGTLFDVQPKFPEGFFYQEEFITKTEEQELLQQILQIDLQHMEYHGFKANRKTASFGYDYSFDNNDISKGKSIPEAFKPLINKVSSFLSLSPDAFAEVLLTEYPPQSVINWHRDAPPFDVIAGISLIGDCIFKLRPYEKLKQTRSAVISFPVQRRSLYIIKDEARSEWQHSTAPVKETRYSITLRTLIKR